MEKIYSVGRICFLFAVAALLNACAFGQKMTYSNTVADVAASGNKTVAVEVHDQRTYVVSGNKQPSFVGLSRGGFGNPFDILTASGHPLGDEMAQSIAHSLNDRGFNAQAVLIGATDSKRAAMEKLQNSGAERLVLIALKEWKSDTYVHTSLIYDVTVRVYDKAGEELVSAQFHGDEPTGDVQAAFRSKVEEWFSDPKVVAALK